MIIAAIVIFWVFVSPGPGVSYTLIGPFGTKADCEGVKHQVIKELQPKKAACIEVPGMPQ